MTWPDFDPELKRELAAVKMLANLTQQAPTREWPLFFDGEHDAMLVVRKWPNGAITAYWASEIRDQGAVAERASS
jgi:hypothetical protein